MTTAAVRMLPCSPELLERSALEATLVPKRGDVDRLLTAMRAPGGGAGAHRILLVAPSGYGKSHVLALVAARLRAARGSTRVAHIDADAGLALGSTRAMLDAILERIADDAPDGSDTAHTTAELEEHLGSVARERGLAVLVDGLDERLEAIGTDGQAELRAFLQNQPEVSLLGTARALPLEVSRREAPFFGFFDVHHLPALDAEQTAWLAIAVAELEGEKTLAKRLDSAKGRRRLEAIRHLFAGRPRSIVRFAQTVAASELDAIERPFERVLDAIAPSVRARLALLSPQQSRIVAGLAQAWHAHTVADIADVNALSHQSASSQLKKLRELRWVVAHPVGRESWYELLDPIDALTLVRLGPARDAIAELVRRAQAHFDPPAARRTASSEPDDPRARLRIHALERDDFGTAVRLPDDAARL